MTRYGYYGPAVPWYLPIAVWEGAQDRRSGSFTVFEQLYRHGWLNKVLYRLGWSVVR